MESYARGIQGSNPIKKFVFNINGKIVNEEDAKISILDRGFLYGDSIYEVTDAIDGVPIFLEEHLDRLWISANKINLEINYLRSEIRHELQKCLEALNTKRAYIRIIITRGVGDITLSTKEATSNNLVIITSEMKDNPSWWYDQGVEVIIANTRRTAKETVDPSVKSGNYLNNVMAYNEAVKRGAFDAIMLNQQGNVTEGTTSNIWVIKDGVFMTPPLKSGLLGGITRAKVIEILKSHSISFEEKLMTENDLKTADEMFLSSSTRRLIPIIKVDDSLISNGRPGKLTLDLLDKYLKLIKG